MTTRTKKPAAKAAEKTTRTRTAKPEGIAAAMKTVDGILAIIAGASRCGKSTYTAERNARAARVVAWDPEAQWCLLPGFVKVTSRAEVAEALKRPGRLRLAYVAGSNLKAEFDFLCQVVFWSGRFIGPLNFIAEELADVTTTAKAPDNWGILVRRGLKRGISIFAISQRWAEADKTAFGNASEYVMFRQSSADDMAYLCRKTRVSPADLDGLQKLDYLRLNVWTGETERGRVGR